MLTYHAVAQVDPTHSSKPRTLLILLLKHILHSLTSQSVLGATGATSGSQCGQTPSDGSRLSWGDVAGERLPVQLRPTPSDSLSVPGGQGVAGSNPVVPTRSEAVSERSGTASALFDDSSDDNVALAAALVVIVEEDIELAQCVVLDLLDDVDVGACGDGD
jgi:hypothetical protein